MKKVKNNLKIYKIMINKKIHSLLNYCNNKRFKKRLKFKIKGNWKIKINQKNKKKIQKNLPKNKLNKINSNWVLLMKCTKNYFKMKMMKTMKILIKNHKKIIINNYNKILIILIANKIMINIYNIMEKYTILMIKINIWNT